ncbi:heme ABC transporter ATP-binding protein [Natronorubrum sp. JWXQ-INN-674]|uniref:Cobalamin import ATP-binding protein BtuD n=1 Tax=Natronorubrum halalkaliphilum TaxID=2691917 RepID=A0A6B0VRX9_9EURY|nr:heme ABC transporter ATP-binding protein [Natronorubrum halalkaliphilum]MXV64390.1 heme ABC transporter ATP-binding protein [Natronorubrum halalkaliphilum]
MNPFSSSSSASSGNSNDDTEGGEDAGGVDGSGDGSTRDADRRAIQTGSEHASEPETLEPATISVENLSLSFGDLSVLENVSLTVDPGEFVGFVGPNGAGKTTLLRAISGALEPDSGTVTIDDTDVHDVSSKASSRLVSVVPQDTALSFSFPIRDVVEMGRHPHRSRFSSPTREDSQAVEHALERTRTADLADRPIDEVSGGQRQRVVLARAIAQGTPAMLLDEPTGSLDINHQLETLELVRELVDDGRTVCAAIHDLDLAARYCDRLVMLADGGVYRSGPPAEVLTGEALADVFDASATVTENPITGTETVTALPDRIRSGQIPRDDDSDTQVRVHVLGTGSIAARALTRLDATGAGLEVSVGPVTSGDVAAQTARSLAVDRLEIPPFESLSPADLVTFENRVEEADAVVIAESVFESSGPGTRQLLESADATADSIVIVADDSSRADTAGSRDRTRGTEATPETLLEAVSNAVENGPDSSAPVSDRASSGAGSGSGSGSTSSDRDSSSGLSAESSGD